MQSVNDAANAAFAAGLAMIAGLRQPSGDFAHRPAQIPIQRFENVLQRAKHESAKHLAVAGRLFRARQAEKLRRSSRDASLGRSPDLVWCPRAAIVSGVDA